MFKILFFKLSKISVIYARESQIIENIPFLSSIFGAGDEGLGIFARGSSVESSSLKTMISASDISKFESFSQFSSSEDSQLSVLFSVWWGIKTKS
jgi:hypothetical protein